ncbi:MULTISPECIES: hypothetical protein [Candidatus Ichthyocystis]|uniref:hypothetical protein n=1 Tax=Candidatus Ichthyocystis TaxID=2929841 RepID=UPI000B804449|nr:MULTISPECIES: hypothetical protein [Ichthyocystis]
MDRTIGRNCSPTVETNSDSSFVLIDNSNESIDDLEQASSSTTISSNDSVSSGSTDSLPDIDFGGAGSPESSGQHHRTRLGSTSHPLTFQSLGHLLDVEYNGDESSLSGEESPLSSHDQPPSYREALRCNTANGVIGMERSYLNNTHTSRLAMICLLASLSSQMQQLQESDDSEGPLPIQPPPHREGLRHSAMNGVGHMGRGYINNDNEDRDLAPRNNILGESTSNIREPVSLLLVAAAFFMLGVFFKYLYGDDCSQKNSTSTPNNNILGDNYYTREY